MKNQNLTDEERFHKEWKEERNKRWYYGFLSVTPIILIVANEYVSEGKIWIAAVIASIALLHAELKGTEHSRGVCCVAALLAGLAGAVEMYEYGKWYRGDIIDGMLKFVVGFAYFFRLSNPSSKDSK